MYITLLDNEIPLLNGIQKNRFHRCSEHLSDIICKKYNNWLSDDVPQLFHDNVLIAERILRPDLLTVPFKYFSTFESSSRFFIKKSKRKSYTYWVSYVSNNDSHYAYTFVFSVIKEYKFFSINDDLTLFYTNDYDEALMHSLKNGQSLFESDKIDNVEEFTKNNFPISRSL